MVESDSDDSFRADSRVLAVASAVAVAYIVGTLLSRQLALAGADLRLAPGVVMGAGLLLGPLAAWGAALGHLLTSVLSGTFTAGTTVGYAAQFVLVLSVYRLWGSFGFLSGGGQPGIPAVRNLIEYLAVATTAITFTTAVTVWLEVLLGEGTFAVGVLTALPPNLVSVLTVGALVLYGGVAVATRRGINLHRPAGRGGWGGFAVLAVSAGWTTAGFLAGGAFEAAEVKVTHQIVNRVGRFVLPVLDVAGPGSVNLQVGGGLAALLACAWVLWRR